MRAGSTDDAAPHDDHVGHDAKRTREPAGHAARIDSGAVPERPKGAAC